MIGLDLDGTVFNNAKEITEHTPAGAGGGDSPRRGGASGYGKAEDRAAGSFLSIPGVRYALTANGGRIVDLETGEPIYQCLIPWELVGRLLRKWQRARMVPGKFIMTEPVMWIRTPTLLYSIRI